MISEHDVVVLTADLPEQDLHAGDVGTVIHVHEHGRAFEVEFSTLTGKTIAISTVPSSRCRPVSQTDITHVREVRTA